MNMESEATERKETERDREDLEEQNEVPEALIGIEPWTKQITVRGIVASIVIGSLYSVIAMKLNLTTGIVPNLNVSAALLGFVFIRTWTKVLERAGYVSKPFTRQENTMIQTCAVACYSIAVGGVLLLLSLKTINCSFYLFIIILKLNLFTFGLQGDLPLIFWD